jgi:cellulose synthase/poly-beta-1,6-N-acetylglucosamine synthase-like glycosyltransferase
VIPALTFAALAAASWALFIYPYLIYPAALRLLSKRPVRVAKGLTDDLRVSLLFCAFNEIQSLPEKLENLALLKAGRPDLQILAYDDASTDGTHELLSSVPELLTVVRGPGRTGKAAGMKQLVQAARGDILVFTDANVLLAADAIDRLLPYYADPEIGGVCGSLHYSSDPASVTAQVGSVYWSLDERLRSLESATGNVMGADGSIFSIRRPLYPEFPDTVLDDLTVSMSVIFSGKRLIKAPDVIAYERSVARRAEELRRKIRIGARAYHTHLHLRPQLRRMSARDQFKYGSRKILRWFGGIFLAVGALFALAAIAALSKVTAVAAVLTGVALVFVSVRSRRGPLARLCDAVLAIFATLIGVLQGMRGLTVATWAPAKSR